MGIIRKTYKKITRDCWEIGFVRGGIDAVMGGSPIKIDWLKHDFKDRWFADPFILDVTEFEIVVLVEEYRYEIGKGRIAELIVDKNTFLIKELNVLLELDTHLSFPAVWREGNRIFIYPESWGSGVLCLYEYLGRGRCLKQIKVICDDTMADAIITDRFGKKMLLSTKENDKLRFYDYDAVSEKFIFSVEKGFGTETARNAGDFFEYGGKVYRPAQVCVNCYGEAVEIQEVETDGIGILVFIPKKRLYSPHPRLKTGFHTLNTYKDVMVIDVHGYVNPLIVNVIIKMKELFLGKEWNRKKQSKL